MVSFIWKSHELELEVYKGDRRTLVVILDNNFQSSDCELHPLLSNLQPTQPCLQRYLGT